MEFTTMVEVTATVPDKEKILNKLERVHKLYPYTSLDKARKTAYNYVYALCTPWWAMTSIYVKNKISDYIDLVVYEFYEKHSEIAIPQDRCEDIIKDGEIK